MTSNEKNIKNGFVTAARNGPESSLQIPDINPDLFRLYMEKFHPERLDENGTFKGYPHRVQLRTAESIKAQTYRPDAFYQCEKDEGEKLNNILAAANKLPAGRRDIFDDALMARCFDLATEIMITHFQKRELKISEILKSVIQGELFSYIESLKQDDNTKKSIDEVILDMHLHGRIDYHTFMHRTGLSPENFFELLFRQTLEALEVILEAMEMEMDKTQENVLPPEIQVKKDRACWGQMEARKLLLQAVTKILKTASPQP